MQPKGRGGVGEGASWLGGLQTGSFAAARQGWGRPGLSSWAGKEAAYRVAEQSECRFKSRLHQEAGQVTLGQSLSVSLACPSRLVGG